MAFSIRCCLFLPAFLLGACMQPHPVSITHEPMVLTTDTVQIVGPHARIERTPREVHVGWWDNEDTSVQWAVRGLQPGNYQIELLYALDQDYSGSTISASLAGRTLTARLLPTGSWDDYQPLLLGSVHIDRPGDQRLTISVTQKLRQYVMNLQRVTIREVSTPPPK